MTPVTSSPQSLRGGAASDVVTLLGGGPPRSRRRSHVRDDVGGAASDVVTLLRDVVWRSLGVREAVTTRLRHQAT